MNLGEIDFDAALTELQGHLGRGRDPVVDHRIAEVASLSAAFVDDLETGERRFSLAFALDPLNPLHMVRRALYLLRSGDCAGALACLDRLPESVTRLSRVAVVRALAMLRSGEAKRARNIAEEVIQADPASVDARFIRVDAHLRISSKGLEKRIAELPRDPVLEPLWVDILGKLVLVRAQDRDTQFVQKFLKSRRPLTKAGTCDQVMHRLLTWAASTDVELEAAIAEAEPGSAQEELLLVLFDKRLTDDGEHLERLRRLHERLVSRSAPRRVYVRALTQLAVEKAAGEDLRSALRAVDACLRIEPQEAIHHQNRAALLTLLGEHEASQDAWADLDRHHYRLALLGRVDPESVKGFGRTHRMFAEQARLTPGSGPNRWGVFVVSEDKDGDIVTRSLEVNHSYIDSDPEQLRAWLLHRAAEHVFAHVALGFAPHSFLCRPRNVRQSECRLDALEQMGEALPVLVPGEGERLHELLVNIWRASTTRTGIAYADSGDEAVALHHVERLHLEHLADLALLCRSWSPDQQRPDLMHEVIDALQAEAAFLNTASLSRAVKAADPSDASALLVLSGFIRHVLESDEEELRFDEAQRDVVVGKLVAMLRTSYVRRRWNDTDTLRPGDVEAMLEHLDAAERDDPGSLEIQFWRANLATNGNYDSEAREAVAAFLRISKGEETPVSDGIEKIQEILGKRDRSEGRIRDGRSVATVATWAVSDVDSLEQALAEQPAAVHLYEELCHAQASARHWDSSESWADRAVGLCLSRAGQLRARALKLEIAGLRELDSTHPQSVSLYLAGSRTAALAGFVQVSVEDGNVGLEYVRGLCHLASGERDKAQASFRRANERNQRGIFNAVLRPLAESVEPILLEQLRSRVDDLLASHKHTDARIQLYSAMLEFQESETCLVDLARIAFTEAMRSVELGEAVSPWTPLNLKTQWGPRCDGAVVQTSPLLRARALAELARDEGPARDRASVDKILRQLDRVDDKLAGMRIAETASSLMKEGRWEDALTELDGVPAAGSASLLIQRALCLLRLHRFDEANELVEAIEETSDPSAAKFVARFPELLFRQRVAAANARIQEADTFVAQELLLGTVATTSTQRVELGYALAYCLAARGYARWEDGDVLAARHAMVESLDILDTTAPAADRNVHPWLFDLRTKIERELRMLEREAQS